MCVIENHLTETEKLYRGREEIVIHGTPAKNLLLKHKAVPIERSHIIRIYLPI